MRSSGIALISALVEEVEAVDDDLVVVAGGRLLLLLHQRPDQVAEEA